MNNIAIKHGFVETPNGPLIRIGLWRRKTTRLTMNVPEREIAHMDLTAPQAATLARKLLIAATELDNGSGRKDCSDSGPGEQRATADDQ